MTSHEDVQHPMRRTHEEHVLCVLREQGPLTRAALGDLVGLSRSTLSEITADLIARGALVALPHPPGNGAGRGRPPRRIALQPSVAQAMGVDFGHRLARVAVVNASHEVIAHRTVHYAESADWDTRTGRVRELIVEMEQVEGVSYGALAAAGIGIPGPLTATEALNGVSPRIKTIQTGLAEVIRAEMIFDNNTRFAALGEVSYLGARVQDLLYVRVADGIGGGLVVGGRLYAGSSGRAGEIGHVVVSPLGSPCRCGGRGCLETVASLPAIVAEARRREPSLRTLAAVSDALASGNPNVAHVVTEAGRAVGTAIAATATVLNPAVVVLTGDSIAKSPEFLHGAQAAVTELSLTGEQPLEVHPSRAGEDGGVLGAIAAVFHHTAHYRRGNR